MARIISVGSAVQDVFLSGKAFKPQREANGELVEEFELGAKLEVEGVVMTTGGGATNAAVTFARQDHKSAIISVVGRDQAAQAILSSLKKEGVDVSGVIRTDKYHTGYSTLLLAPSGERTILVHRGASEHFQRKDFDLEHVKADWLYITSLAGNLELLGYLLTLAEHKGIKTALDPGSRELKQSTQLKKLLPKLTLLKGNRDELGKLVGGDNAEDTVRALAKKIPYVVVTDGSVGSIASDGKRLIKAGMYKKVEVVDRTGAGDAFGSGLVAALAREESLEKALTLASANSTSVVTQIGAKAGILKKGSRLKPMALKISKL